MLWCISFCFSGNREFKVTNKETEENFSHNICKKYTPSIYSAIFYSFSAHSLLTKGVILKSQKGISKIKDCFFQFCDFYYNPVNISIILLWENTSECILSTKVFLSTSGIIWCISRQCTIQPNSWWYYDMETLSALYALVNWINTASGNGLSPVRCQAITWTNADLSSIGPLWTNFSEIWIKILTFSFNKKLLIMPSVKWQPFCPGGDELTHWGRVMHICVSKLTIIDSDNGLSPKRRQAIIWTTAGILSIRS